MAEDGGEQDKSESATPLKLDHARRKGMIARGTDLGFLTALLGFAAIAQVSGAGIVNQLSQTFGRAIASIPTLARNPAALGARTSELVQPAVQALLLPAIVLMCLCIAVEVIQNRGLVFTAQPLKPDFSKLNPAKGLKRLFSGHMLRELGKNILKFGLYGAGAYLLISKELRDLAGRARDGRHLAAILVDSAGRLLLLFIILAAAIAVLDQMLARRTFARQMRMSKREVTREVREREGEPRQKRKRKQILEEIIRQATSASNVKGADVLIVNPIHYAVALRYQPGQTDAPVIQASGRNLWAQKMRTAAEREGITIIRSPALARALYREGRVGQQIGGNHFVAVADIYIALRRAMRDQDAG